MSIAEKLTTIAENEQKVFDAGKKSVYESVVFTADCTKSKQTADFLNQYVAPNDKLVIFINKKWNGIPASETPNSQGLWMMLMAEEFRPDDITARYAPWCRWRDGTYVYGDYANNEYDFIVSAGEEWLKVVLRGEQSPMLLYFLNLFDLCFTLHAISRGQRN